MKKFISLLALATALTGCVNYQSKITVGGASFTLPKDATFSWLQCQVPTTNGVCSLVISNGVFKMNPAVIDSQTAHDVAVINATATAIGDVAGKAAAAAAGKP